MTRHRQARAYCLLALALLGTGSRDNQRYPYSIDSAGLSAPPLATMELRIEGDDLVPTRPDGDERGRYSHD